MMDENEKRLLAVDEYISQAPLHMQETLQNIRKIVQDTAPQAEELIRFAMPAYHLHGKPLIYFAIHKKHIGLYPGVKPIEVFRDKLSDYKCSKGGIQFPFDKPVPYDLVREILQFKMDGMR